jgi:hypothetical protein
MKPLVILLIAAGLLMLGVGWFTPMPYRLAYGGAGLATLLFGPFCLLAGFAMGRDSR